MRTPKRRALGLGGEGSLGLFCHFYVVVVRDSCDVAHQSKWFVQPSSSNVSACCVSAYFPWDS